MSAPCIIVISGKAGAGKDTLGKMIAEDLEEKDKCVLVTHYADLLKYLCTSLFHWDGKKDEKGRSLLQYVGTDVIRKKEPDFWVNFIANVLSLFPNEWDYVIIPDCRFPNEIDVLKSAGYKVVHIRVTRNNYMTLTASQQCHPSETALDGVTPDYIIENNGDLDDLRKSFHITFNNEQEKQV